MNKHGCFKINWTNRQRNYPSLHGHIYAFPNGVDDDRGPGIATPVVKITQNDASVLCRYDLRMSNPRCSGCAKPWDIDYIRKAFGNEYLTTQLQTVQHGRS